MSAPDADADPDDLERAVLDLLDRRADGATICPSEVARAVAAEGQEWRDLMDPVRAAVGRLVERDAVDVTQRGEVVDLASARGPIRVRRRS
ncbi:DUF3253 domain-containing protein [Nocardioides zeae]|uniref:DUF3253 domain-containing protein n=1 Tax=Nocardioides zeae TaxID=1457234 RepID=A0AAJ1X1D1_9ACTN|nr:DUF3253 domain-containing protein [Nocardioides zeae]MDQ1104781.1 hypothetical protein [Nocardioides zeae]